VETLELYDTTITGNVSGGEGFGVWIDDATYDGHSYFRSYNKWGGNVVIKDNEGGDLWMGPDVTVAIVKDGLGKDTHIELTLDSGVLTQRVWGAYHYEGGNQKYTITYGDRSVTDPEIDESLVTQEQTNQNQTNEKKASGDIWLYVGIGAFAALVLAIGAVLIVKKKKAGNPKEPAGKE